MDTLSTFGDNISRTHSVGSGVSRRRKSLVSTITSGSNMSVPRVRRKTGLLSVCFDWCETPSLKTERGRNMQMMYLVLLPMIPVLTLGINSTWRMGFSIYEVVQFDAMLNSIAELQKLDTLITSLQNERANDAAHIITNGTMTNFVQQYILTDRHFNSLKTWPIDGVLLSPFYEKEAFALALIQQRSALTPSEELMPRLRFYSSLTENLIDWASTILWDEQKTEQWPEGVAYYYLLHAQDAIGLQMALGSVYFTVGILNEEQYSLFIRSHADSIIFINISMQHSPVIEDFLNLNFYDRVDAANLDHLWQKIIGNKRQPYDMELEQFWSENITNYLDVISTARADSLDRIADNIQHARNIAYRQLIQDIVGLIISLALGPFVFLIMRKLTTSIKFKMSDLLYKQAQAKFEKRKTEELLYQMLPKQVVLQLRMHNKVAAESFDEVTIMFSDIKNFTEISNISTPMQIVNTLNAVYNHIDASLEKHDVYKVETISDVYMVVSGCPIPNGVRHVTEIANLAIEMIESTKTFRVPHLRQEVLQLRIGMNSGSCVAGVVGEKMPRYCLFGDTVNTAARMQTNGLPLKIHMSPTSQDLLDRLGGYIIQFRGIMSIKGKGDMRTYWLTDRVLDDMNNHKVGFRT